MSILRRDHRHEDPGPAWAEALLAPLRSTEVECEVARSVMTRIASSRPAPLRSPIRLRWPRLALTGCVAGGVLSLGIVVGALVALVLSGDDGVRQLQTLAGSLGTALLALGEFAFALLKGILSAGLALLRAAWAVIDAAAPLVRGAGMAAAACGMLTIVISLYLLTQAYRTAPLAVTDRDAGTTGGTR
jgi:hypothetical protein